MVLLDSVSKSFRGKRGIPVKALEEIQFHIPRGMAVGVIGPSGAGKTTLLKLIGGLLKPDRGRVRVNGRNPLVEGRQAEGDVNILLADCSPIHIGHSLKEELSLLQAVYSLDAREFRQRSRDIAERFFPQKAWEQSMRELSLGYRRRVEVALEFLTPAKLLLFDEPSIGMDGAARNVFLELVAEEKEKGRTIVISSHNMSEIGHSSDRILLINKGRMVYYGEQERLFRNLAPISQIHISFSDSMPDMQDLPFVRYKQEGRRMVLSYNRNHISAAELLRGIGGNIQEMSMRPPTLEQVICELEGGNDELY